MSLIDIIKGFVKKTALGLLAGSIATGSCSCVSLVYNACQHDNSQAYKGQVKKQISIEEKNILNIITHNIAHCRGPLPDAENDFAKNLTIKSKRQIYECLDTLAEMYMEEKTDIVCLQETDWEASWSFDINYVKYLAKKAGFNYYAFGTKWDHVWPFAYPRDKGWIFPTIKTHIGNAVLSKYPIVSAKNRSFDGKDIIDWLIGEESYLDTLIDVNGKEIRVISTHFSSSSWEDREVAAKRLVHEAQNSDLPLIIAGDFNTVLPRAKRERKELAKQYGLENTMETIVDSRIFNVYMENINSKNKEYFTSNSIKKETTLDFIIPTRDVEILQYYVHPARYSDHYAVFAKIKLKLEDKIERYSP
jgi:endonuclease/exonuclease/phosphatase family metal-dependent hydrolase